MAPNEVTEMIAARAAQGAGRANERIGVVDIGSNSIRLVVFDRLSRAPVPLFNERVLCGLARGLDQTGRLNVEGVELALTNIVRFARLARAMSVGRFDLLATAAVREAANGPEFVAEVERRSGAKVTVLSGASEARLSALGVIAGTPGANGFMGDLGGGSLELVDLRAADLRDSVTLPLGPLRLAEVSNGDRALALAEIDRHLDAVAWLNGSPDACFYPVGGAWRSLARLHMEQSRYPLHIIHGYSLPSRTARDMARVISRLGPHSLARVRGVSRRRLETLPYAALVLSRILERVRPATVTFSAFGLREGHVYDLLGPEEQARDPLIAAASELAASEARFGDLGEEMFSWTTPLCPDETPEEVRLRRAAGHLADIAWREHPDYRAVQALHRILRLPLLAIDHAQRGFLAYTAFVRYGGKPGATDAETAIQLMSARQAWRAEVLGKALRLAVTVSGGTREVLRSASLSLEGDSLVLTLPGNGSVVSGDALERRLKALAKALGVSASEIR